MSKIAGFWKNFQISLEHYSKNIIWKNSNFCINNQPRRYYKMHVILFPKTNLKRKKFFCFSENIKNENSNVLEKFSSYISVLEGSYLIMCICIIIL